MKNRQTRYTKKRYLAQVAGMVFHLLDEDEMQQLADNQAKIKALTTKLKRRKALSGWGDGQMHPLGFRQPSGGRPGDGYAPYPGSEVLSREDVHALFGYASVSYPLPCGFVGLLEALTPL